MKKLFVITFVLTLSMVLTGCGPQTIHKVKQELNIVTASADDAVKINHNDYVAGLYGPVGSDKAVAARVKVATVLNGVLTPISVAVEISASMTPANFTGSKAQIIQLLQTAANVATKQSTGNPKIDIALQAIAASINTALTVIQAFTSADAHVSPSLFREQTVALERVIQANQEDV